METKMTECERFICGGCRIMQYPGMFGEEIPPNPEGVPFAGEMAGNEEGMVCMKKKECKEYLPQIAVAVN